MFHQSFPVIDPIATGRNILNLRREKGLSVKQLQSWFNFEEPRAIYKWQSGQSLPSLEHFYALSVLFDVPMEKIIIRGHKKSSDSIEPQEETCGSVFIAPSYDSSE